MAISVFFDDSTKGDTTVLAGCAFLDEDLDKFDSEWRKMLTMYSSWDEFKMSHHGFSNSIETWHKIQSLHRIIERYSKLYIVNYIDKGDFDEISTRLHDPIGQNGSMHFLFGQILNITFDFFAKYDNSKLISVNFDHQSEVEIVVSEVWPALVHSFSDRNIRNYGTPPQFKDSKKTSHLQAADFLAWWAREQLNPEHSRQKLFTKFSPPCGKYGWNSDKIIPTLVTIINKTLIEDKLSNANDSWNNYELVKRLPRNVLEKQLKYLRSHPKRFIESGTVYCSPQSLLALSSNLAPISRHIDIVCDIHNSAGCLLGEEVAGALRRAGCVVEEYEAMAVKSNSKSDIQFMLKSKYSDMKLLPVLFEFFLNLGLTYEIVVDGNFNEHGFDSGADLRIFFRNIPIRSYGATV